jgi:hypothetical protein
MKRFLLYGIVILFVLTACEQAQGGGGTGVPDGATTGTGTETKLFAITGSSTGALKRGSSRQFTVNPKEEEVGEETSRPDGPRGLLAASFADLRTGGKYTAKIL